MGYGMQVPRDVTEDMLKPYFTPYGDIEHINILRTQRGQSSGTGFHPLATSPYQLQDLIATHLQILPILSLKA